MTATSSSSSREAVGGRDRPGRAVRAAAPSWRGHYHSQARVYRDVIVQVSDDKDFLKGVTSIQQRPRQLVGPGDREGQGVHRGCRGEAVRPEGGGRPLRADVLQREHGERPQPLRRGRGLRHAGEVGADPHAEITPGVISVMRNHSGSDFQMGVRPKTEMRYGRALLVGLQYPWATIGCPTSHRPAWGMSPSRSRAWSTTTCSTWPSATRATTSCVESTGSGRTSSASA